MAIATIAIDIDEVLSPLHKPFLEHHNQHYGSDFIYPDPLGRYYLEEFTGEASDIAELKITDFVSHPDFLNLTMPLPGAVAAISALHAADYRLIIVTGRQSTIYTDVTDQFVGRYFPGMFAEIHYIPYFRGSALSPAQAKIEICQQAGASYLIDDNLKTAIAAADSGIKAILFGDYHWNESTTLPTGVTRCLDWPALQELFDGVG